MKNTEYKKRMSRIARAMNAIKAVLKSQEASNKELRNKITEAWSDRTRDAEVKEMQRSLKRGRKTVTGYQTALHELKWDFKAYNFEFTFVEDPENAGEYAN
jgi:hypothetical protein